MQIESLLGDTPRAVPGRVALEDGARSITYSSWVLSLRRKRSFFSHIRGCDSAYWLTTAAVGRLRIWRSTICIG